jgi:hypothetical protein
MSEEVFSDGPAAVLCPRSGGTSSSRVSELLAKQFAEGLNNIGPGIALAGAAYPLLLAFGYPVVAFVYLLTSRATWGDFNEALIGPLLFSLFGAGIGLVWATIVAFAILPLVYLFVRSLELRGSIVRLGAFCGGLVGFVAVMPFFIGAMSGITDTLAEIALIVLLGPALTTIVGQLGGAWGGWRTRWYERAVAQAAIAKRGRPEELPANISTDYGHPNHHRLQFGIRHLLVISIWISVLLTGIRLSGLDYRSVLLLIGGWSVYQMATLWVGGLLLSLFGSWKSRRQTRST